jgi:hypothetical protein
MRYQQRGVDLGQRGVDDHVPGVVQGFAGRRRATLHMGLRFEEIFVEFWQEIAASGVRSVANDQE